MLQNVVALSSEVVAEGIHTHKNLHGNDASMVHSVVRFANELKLALSLAAEVCSAWTSQLLASFPFHHCPLMCLTIH